VNLPERVNGKLPRYTSYGCYPIVYLTRRDNCLCADCATANDDEDDPTVIGDVHWEGAPLTCDECGEEIESAYGDPDAEKESE